MSFIVLPIQFFPNTGFGVGALQTGAGSRNVALGTDALAQITNTGDDNIAIGYRSGRFLSTQDGNVLVGSGTMENATGAFNIAVGLNALKGAISINQPSQNVAIGNEALFFTDSASQCVAIGQAALRTTNSGNENVALGYAAGYSNLRGGSNVFIGNSSGFNFQTSTLGEQTSNTFVGTGSGSQITTGRRNTIVGRYNGNQGGLDIRTLNDYVVLSDGNGNPRLYIDGAGLVTAPGGFAGIGGGITLNNQTSTYNIVASDAGKAINCTSGTFTVSTDPAATLGSGFACFVWNTGTGTITINPNGAETIDGLTTLVLRQGEGTQIVCDGTNWLTGSKKTMRAYAENIAPGSLRPSATGSGSVAIGNFAQAGGSDSIAIGGLSIAGNAQTLAIGYGTQANPSYSCAIGQNSFGSGSQAATNFGAMALGGSYSSGTDSFSAAIGNNTSTYGARGSNSIAIGYLAISTAVNGISIGAQSNTSATGAVAIGDGAVSTGQYSFSNGYYAVSTIYGKQAYASGRFASSGDAQSGKHVLRIPTTGAVATVLTTNGGAAGTTNQLILSNNSAYAFTGTVVARQQASGGTQSAAWTVEGLIRREANAGTTTLVASTVTAISNAPGWTLALSADTTNGGLAVTATGAAATNIRWVANIDTSEVTYP